MDLADWSELFVAAAGASAALAGLIIVAMSVNIDVIVRFASLPSRAGATIALLVVVVVVSILGLVPELPLAVAGAVTLAAGAVCLAFGVDATIRMVRDRGAQGVGNGLVLLLPSVAFVVGGGMLAAGAEPGMNIVAAGMILAFVSSVLNAWVLLVEIRR